MKNRILEALPADEGRGLAAQMTRVHLARSTVLFEPGDTPEYIYFPLEALISQLGSTAEGQSIEVGLVGNEGLVGAPTLLSDVAAFRAVVQIAGAAFRIKSVALKQEFLRSDVVRQQMLSYLNALLIQVAQTSVCNKFHNIDTRLCRWLLMAIDRAGTNDLAITHEALARVLGTRRASITIVLGELQRAGAVRNVRGTITIVNRLVLEKNACECYETILNAHIGASGSEGSSAACR